MSKKERINFLEKETHNLRATVEVYAGLSSNLCDRVSELERKIAAIEAHVVQLLAEAARAKSPPKPGIPWDSGEKILEEHAKRQAEREAVKSMPPPIKGITQDQEETLPHYRGKHWRPFQNRCDE